jgi:FlaG/FlaF family flagellin (archaellin)
MMTSKSIREEAVSPVVGVMLMLVVTIIIAAIVSAFSGGMASSQKATPSMVLQGQYSQTSGMTITHAGGDPVALSEVTFVTVPSELMGADAGKFAYAFPKYILRTTNGTPVVNQTSGFYQKAGFVAGDVLTINQTDCNDYATDAQLATSSKTNQVILGKVNIYAQDNWGTVDENNPADKSVAFRAYEFSNPNNIGKYFYLNLLDAKGNLITQAKVAITG